jgi:Sodium/hydrogen exchanger family.
LEFLGTLVIILITTSLFGHLASRVGIPSVIGQLFVGIILGPALLNWVHANDFIHIFQRLGLSS